MLKDIVNKAVLGTSHICSLFIIWKFTNFSQFIILDVFSMCFILEVYIFIAQLQKLKPRWVGVDQSHTTSWWRSMDVNLGFWFPVPVHINHPTFLLSGFKNSKNESIPGFFTKVSSRMEGCPSLSRRDQRKMNQKLQVCSHYSNSL